MTRIRSARPILLAAVAFTMLAGAVAAADMRRFKVPSGEHPHDIAPAPDGTVWYTAQHAGALGRLGEVWGPESGTDTLFVIPTK